MQYLLRAVSLTLLIAPPEVLEPKYFLSKNLKTIEARPLWYQSYFGFLAVLNAFSCNILSEAVLPGKSSNIP